jgi:hypothetical protein
VLGSSPDAVFSADVRRLTGSTVSSAITSFFRKSLLVGSKLSDSAEVASYGGTSYPPKGDAAAVGYEELKLAWAAGEETVALTHCH